MRLKTYKKWLAILTLMAVTLPSAQATPAFARQMSMDCMSCHYQNIPKLNSFGRSFKLSGFTMRSGLEGTSIDSTTAGGMSIPATLNVAFVTKARVIGETNAREKTEIFDEAALLFGGRVSESMGTSMEFTEGLVGGKFIYSKEALGGRVGLAYYMTDALGVFSSTEAYSTGLYRAVRQFENRKGANIFQKVGVGSGAATGINTYYNGNGVYATAGIYVPAFGNVIDTSSDFKIMARAAYEMNLGGHEVSIGGYYLGGDINNSVSKINDSGKIAVADTAKFDEITYGIDIQTQGNIGEKTLMITFGYVLSNTDSADTVDNGGLSLETQLNLTDRLGFKVAYLSYKDNKDSTNDVSAVSGGVEFNANQNIRLVLEYTNSSKNSVSSDKILFMSHIAF